MTKTIIKVILGLMSLSAPVMCIANAEVEDRKFELGPTLGRGSNRYGSGDLITGIVFNYKVSKNFAVGYYGISGSYQYGTSYETYQTQSVQNFLASFTYFPESMPGFWFAGRVGLVKFNFMANSDTRPSDGQYDRESGTVWSWSPAIGYDFRINRLLSLGVDFSVLTGEASWTTGHAAMLAVGKVHF